MSHKQAKRQRNTMRVHDPLHGLLSIHRTGEQVQRIEFNFKALLDEFGATLYGVDMAPDRVIFHCQLDSQENYELRAQRVLEKVLDTGLIERQDGARPETLLADAKRPVPSGTEGGAAAE